MHKEGSKLRKGEVLHKFEWLASENERYMLTLEPDGSLMLSFGDKVRVLWKPSGKGNLLGDRLVMEEDGNLVFYDSRNATLWQTNTTNRGEYASVDNRGALIVYDSRGNHVWSSSNLPKSEGFHILGVFYLRDFAISYRFKM